MDSTPATSPPAPAPEEKKGLFEIVVTSTPVLLTVIASLWTVGVFIAKVVTILFVYVIIRWTLPRFKYNQLMNLGWKRLVPLALANVMIVAAIGVLTQSGGGK